MDRGTTEDEKGSFDGLGRNAEASISEEPGATCPQGQAKTARRDLCGGCWATGSPTAMAAQSRSKGVLRK